MKGFLFVVAFAAFSGCVRGWGIRGYCREACPWTSKRDFMLSPNILPDENVLKQHCGNLLAFGDCMLEASRKCPRLRNWELGDLIPTELAVNASRAWCDEDSPLGKLYRENVDCVNGASQTLTDVSEALSSHVRGFLDFLDQESPDYGMTDIVCIYLKHIPELVGSTLSSECGNGPEEFLKLLFRPVLSNCKPEYVQEFELMYVRYTLQKLQQIFRK